MTEKKRRFLSVVAPMSSSLAGVIVLLPQGILNDQARGGLAGILIGLSIVALIKLKRTPATPLGSN